MKNTVGLGLPEYSFNTSHKATVIGAGLAGCAIANALAQRGYRCKLIDQQPSAAAGASALPVAVVRPAIGGDTFYSTYFNQAFDLCCSTLTEKLFNQCGALELTDNLSRHHNKTDIEHNKHITDFVTAGQASVYAGTKLNNSALYVKSAGIVVPRQVCEQWIKHPLIELQPGIRLNTLKQTMYGWQLLADNDTVIDESQLVILATAACTQFDITSDVPLQRVVGQIDRFEYTGSPLQCVVNGRGYLAPDTLVSASSAKPAGNAHGVWCGATHHRNITKISITDSDSALNRATATSIAPMLQTDASPATNFAEARSFTPDRLPVIGAIPDSSRYRTDYADFKHGRPSDRFPPPVFHRGLYLAAGLGSRGATQALLVGELMASLICGDTEDHHRESDDHRHQTFYKELHPARFLMRALRRGL